MTITDILVEMKSLLTRRADVEREMSRLTRAGHGFRSPVISGMPRGAPLRPETIEVTRRLEALVEEMEAVEIDLTAFRRRLEPYINALPDGPQTMMLRLRYIHWLPVAQASKEAGYNRQYGYRLLEEGEKAVSSP